MSILQQQQTAMNETVNDHAIMPAPIPTPTPLGVRRMVKHFLELVILMVTAAVLFAYAVSLPKREEPPTGAIAVNRQGQIVQWSPEAEKATGWSERDVFGTDFYALLAKDNRDACRKDFLAKVMNGQAGKFSFYVMGKKGPARMEYSLTGGNSEYQILGVVKGKQ